MLSRRSLLQNAGVASVCSMAPLSLAAAEPAPRHDAMIVHRYQPLNAEPRPAALRSAFITRQSDFYIRNHGTLPRLDASGYSIRVAREGTAPVEFTLDDLRRKFPKRMVTAVMQCAGNRRVDMLKVKNVSGDEWGVGAISNAVWTGVALGDVLKAAGVVPGPDLHVAFACHDEVDEDGEHFNFGVSIPLSKAMSQETILAFEMNGEPLTAEHGFPVRAVVPGYAGVRSPKWLASITVQDRPSDNHIQQKEYKLFPPTVTKETADLAKGVTINDMPLNSAICEPSEHDLLHAGRQTIRGYVISTASPVARVDVSSDGGQSWQPADLENRAGSPWSWVFWNARLDLAKGRQELVVRAVDKTGNQQPATPAEVWNYPGYLETAWHRVNVRVV